MTSWLFEEKFKLDEFKKTLKDNNYESKLSRRMAKCSL